MFLKQLADEQVTGMLQLVGQVLCRLDGFSRKTVLLALLALSSHKITTEAPFEPVADELTLGTVQCLQSCSTQIVEDALKALRRLLQQCTAIRCNTATWFPFVLTLLFSDTVSVRCASHDLLALFPIIPSNSMQLAWTANNTANTYLADCVALLRARASSHLPMMLAWGHVLDVFGSTLHKKTILNEVLRLLEHNFNSSQPEQRIGALDAWRHLIFNFSCDAHLLHQKRLKLVNIPIWNCLRYEAIAGVQDAGFRSFLYLVFHLSIHKSPLPKMLELYVLPVASHLPVRLRPVFLSCIGKSCIIIVFFLMPMLIPICSTIAEWSCDNSLSL